MTVGWFGCETAFYETIRLREMPLIAEQEVEVSVASVTYADPSPALGGGCCIFSLLFAGVGPTYLLYLILSYYLFAHLLWDWDPLINVTLRDGYSCSC